MPRQYTLKNQTKAERKLQTSAAALRSHALHDPAERLAPAHAAFEARFYAGIPEDLPQSERDRRAACKRKAFFIELTRKSVVAARLKREAES